MYFATADPDEATIRGLVNMGYSGNEAYSWITTETYQLLNHQVSPAAEALTCNDCHSGSNRIRLEDELGYQLKSSESVVCRQCHGNEGNSGFYNIHAEHVDDMRFDCINCHTFSRPERGLR